MFEDTQAAALAHDMALDSHEPHTSGIHAGCAIGSLMNSVSWTMDSGHLLFDTSAPLAYVGRQKLHPGHKVTRPGERAAGSVRPALQIIP